MNLYWCSGCERDLPRGCFYSDKTRSTGVQSNCKECHAQRAATRKSAIEQQLDTARANSDRASRYVLQLLDFIRSHDLTPPDPE